MPLLIGVLHSAEATLGYSCTSIDLIAFFVLFFLYLCRGAGGGGEIKILQDLCLAFSSFGKQCKTDSETRGHLGPSWNFKTLKIIPETGVVGHS